MEENNQVNITPVQIPAQPDNKAEIKPDSTDCVKENDSVILLENGQKYAVVRISKRAQTRIGKQRCNLDPLIGAPYGTYFEARAGKLYKLDKKPELSLSFPIADTMAEDGQTKKNNKELVDDNKAQGLSAEEITEMKKKGVGGESIIQALIQNSSSFQNKTEFSQQKYIKKKQEKYLHYIEVLPPSTQTLTKVYFAKAPAKICFLRLDSMSYLLSMAEIRANHQILIIEDAMGLIVGSAAQRLNGQGRIINCFLGKSPNTPVASMFNLSKEFESVIEHIPFGRVQELAFGDQAPVETKEQEESEVKIEDMQVEKNQEEEENIDIEQPKEPQEGQDKNNAATREKKQKETEDHLFEGADSLIIATTRADVKSLLEATYPFLVPGQPFSIYSPYIEPLATCHQWLKESDTALNLTLGETFYREYQVLPQRTHPLMRIPATGGYVLTGTKILNNLPPAATTNEVGSPSQPKQKKQKV